MSARSTAPASRPAAGPAARRTVRYRTPTVATPISACGSSSDQLDSPNSRTESSMTHSDAGRLVDGDGIRAVEGSEEEGLPALRAGLHRGGVEGVRPAAAAQAPAVEERRSRRAGRAVSGAPMRGRPAARAGNDGFGRPRRARSAGRRPGARRGAGRTSGHAASSTCSSEERGARRALPRKTQPAEEDEAQQRGQPFAMTRKTSSAPLAGAGSSWCSTVSAPLVSAETEGEDHQPLRLGAPGAGPPRMPKVSRRFAAVLAIAVIRSATRFAPCAVKAPRRSRKITR